MALPPWAVVSGEARRRSPARHSTHARRSDVPVFACTATRRACGLTIFQRDDLKRTDIEHRLYKRRIELTVLALQFARTLRIDHGRPELYLLQEPDDPLVSESQLLLARYLPRTSASNYLAVKLKSRARSTSAPVARSSLQSRDFERHP